MFHETLPFDEQAAHSKGTGQNVYSRSHQESMLITSIKERNYFYVSQIWQYIIGIIHFPNLSRALQNVIQENQIINVNLENDPINQHHQQQQFIHQSVSQTTTEIVNEISYYISSLKIGNQQQQQQQQQVQGRTPNVKDNLKYKEALFSLFGNGNSKFRDINQAICLHEAITKKNDVLFISGTGSGKSTLMFLIAKISKGVTVVISPLIALRAELILKAEKFGIVYDVFNAQKFPSKIPKLLFVPVTQMEDNQFQVYMDSINTNLERVIFDEVHQFLTSDYRAGLKEKLRSRKSNYQTLFFSATMPPKLELELKEIIQNNLLLTLRTSTARDNLKIKIIQIQKNQMFTKAIQIIEEKKIGIQEKVLIYCMTVQEIYALHDLMGKKGIKHQIYTGQMKEDEREKNLNEWKDGVSGIMISTTALGAGIDIDEIVLIIHVSGSYSLLDYAQGIGRGCRKNNKIADCITLIENPVSKNADNEFENWIKTPGCRRKSLFEAIDGLPTLVCEGAALCDVCEKFTGT